MTLSLVRIKFYNNDVAFTPKRMTLRAAGYDLFSPSKVRIHAGETVKIPLNFSLLMPEGYYATIVARSSMARKGLIIPNAPATIDQDYNQEWQLLLHYLNPNPDAYYDIEIGDRIAQMIFRQCVALEFESEKEAGERLGGLGSTGI